MQSQNYDAIVVGSGISGGWAAKELTEKGLRVLLLERGKNIEHIKDYPNATKAPWDYPHRGRRTKTMEAAYPVLKRDYPLNETNLDWWASDQESPYTEVKRFDWYRGYHVGGRSLMWGRQSYRWSDFDFEANAREGIGVDWPIRYADIAPWYDHVERHAGISGSLEGMAQLPDGQFQPPMPLNCGEELIAGRLKQHFDGRRRIIPGRTANLTQPLPGRAQCQFRNACWLGCPFGGYFSTQSSTLPAAMATGRLTLKPFAIVTEVLYDRNKKRATGVRVLDAVTNQTTDYTAKVVFLCASTLNSTWLLLRSATDVWPGGLEHLSHVVHHVLAHQPLVLAGGAVDREHRESPFVLLVRIDGDPVRWIGEHLAERGAADRPRSGLCRRVLERGAHAQLGHRARPPRTAGAALVPEAARVLALVAEQIAVARNVEAGGTPAVVRFVVEPFDSAGRTRTEMVIHEIAAQGVGARAKSARPDVGRRAQQEPGGIQRGRTKEDDFRGVVGGLIRDRIEHAHTLRAFLVAIVQDLGDDRERL